MKFKACASLQVQMFGLLLGKLFVCKLVMLDGVLAVEGNDFDTCHTCGYKVEVMSDSFFG